LVAAFSLLRVEFPNADLTILGRGVEEAALKSLRRELQLDACVYFRGHVPRAESYFAGATLFVLSSRHEGLPNALLEAAAAGLPIVALPAGGVSELLRDKPGTWLASEMSSQALAHTLHESLHALVPGQRFAHPWIDAYQLDRAIDRYEELIDDTLDRTAH
jgi:glycosyltransferase involved in cell wall biosynthesis